MFRALPSNGQQWWESTINWRYSRCTDWKFYTWFHLNSTNGSIIAPFHHFPSLDDIKGSSLREASKDEYIQLGTWTKLISDHVCICLLFTLKRLAFDLTTIRVPLRILEPYLLVGQKNNWACFIIAWFTDPSLFSPRGTISFPPWGGFHQLKQLGPVLKLQMASVRPHQNLGLPANCSDMSDMLVCLVNPHPSAVTKVEPTPLLSVRPERLEEMWGVTEPQSQGQEFTPDSHLS